MTVGIRNTANARYVVPADDPFFEKAPREAAAIAPPMPMNSFRERHLFAVSFVDVDVDVNEAIKILLAVDPKSEPETLKLIVGKINTTNLALLRDEQKKNVVDAICSGRFGMDKTVLAKLAKVVSTMNISEAVLQDKLINAICSGRFGADKEVLVTVAESLHRMRKLSEKQQRRFRHPDLV